MGGGVRAPFRARLREDAVLAQERHVEALPLEPVDGVARLVRDPLLVHRLVETRLHAHDLVLGRVDADRRAARVERVDRVGHPEG
eukprot:2797761-Pleurochrysis_carterae.AAC.2